MKKIIFLPSVRDWEFLAAPAGYERRARACSGSVLARQAFFLIFMARDIMVANDASNLPLWLGFLRKAVHGSEEFC